MITNLMKPSDKANFDPDEDTNIFDKDEIPDWLLDYTGDYNNVATISTPLLKMSRIYQVLLMKPQLPALLLITWQM
jgi:hypothetical protein